MTIKTTISIAAVLLALCVSYAAAEERLGVAVYPGASYDQAMTDVLKKNPTVEGAAYRTRDGIAEVTEFYRKQGLVFLRIGSPSKESARFKKADTGVDVVLRNPWKDPHTGAMVKETLIMIIKERE